MTGLLPVCTVVTVGLGLLEYAVNEEVGSVTVCAVLTGLLERGVAVTLSTVADGNAQGTCIIAQSCTASPTQ